MRSLLLGLLLAGVYSISSKAPTSAISEIREICHRTTDLKNCSLSRITDNSLLNSNSGLPETINLLLPQWTINRCRSPSSRMVQDLFCWALGTQLLNFNSNHRLIAQNNLQEEQTSLLATELSPKSYQFPRLPRSSLIVTSPGNNPALCSLQPATINTCSSNKPIFINPAPKTTRIASPFGWRRRPYSDQLQFHRGIDYGAPLNSPVVAVENGIVTKIVSGCADFGNRLCGNQFGNWIEIDHGHGAIAIYGHLLNSSIVVKPGMKVRKNQKIAKVGSSGWSTGAHLDFRLKIRGKYQNPAEYIP